MKKFALLLGCLISLTALIISIINISTSAKQPQIPEENIPHIFHGVTKSFTIGKIGEDGDIIGYTEHKLCALKYALYLDNGLIAIFDGKTQLHHIVVYIGSEQSEEDTRYLFATFDQDENQGYVEVSYCNDGTVIMILDYSDYVIGYILDTYMPQAEFEEHLKKYNRE